jgi:hypothetical protein
MVVALIFGSGATFGGGREIGGRWRAGLSIPYCLFIVNIRPFLISLVTFGLFNMCLLLVHRFNIRLLIRPFNVLLFGVFLIRLFIVIGQ